MNADKDQILETFFRVLGHISDKDYQIRVWIEGVGPEVDDFDETCCYFFVEADSILKNYTYFGLCWIIPRFASSAPLSSCLKAA